MFGRMTLVAACLAVGVGCREEAPAPPPASPAMARQVQAVAAPVPAAGARALPATGWAGVPPKRVLHVAKNGDDAGPGTLAKPWRTIGRGVRALQPGDALHVHTGVYQERVHVPTRGTAAAPVRVMAAPGEAPPVLKGGDRLQGAFFRVSGAYVVLEGFRVEAAGSNARAVHVEGAQGLVVRGFQAWGGTGPSAIAVGPGSRDVLLQQNHLYGWTWGTRDSHAVVVTPDVQRVAVVDSHHHGNGGDSVQCVGPDASPGTQVTTDLTIEGNRFHAERENAVDLKTCHHVTVRGNKMFDFRPAASAPQGAAMVVHMSAAHVLIEGNRIWDSGRALTVGGVQPGPAPVRNVVVRRNLVFQGTAANGGSGDAFRAGTVKGIRFEHNTIHGMPVRAFRFGDGGTGPTEDVVMLDNLVVDTPVVVDLRTSGVRGLQADTTVAWGVGKAPVWLRDGKPLTLAQWQAATGQDKASRAAPVQLVPNPMQADFYTQPGSPARDVARTPVPGARVCGRGPDVGFLESC